MRWPIAALVALLALTAPASARAGWSAPLMVARTSAEPAAVAVDAAGDAAIAWVTLKDRPPVSLNRYCATHSFKPKCYAIGLVHLAVRTAAGRTASRTVWQGRGGPGQLSLVIARGEVALGLGQYDVSDENETAREVHGPLLGRWSSARVLGHFYDVNFTGGRTPLYPQLAVGADGRVLAAWSACPSVKACPGRAPGVTLAWRVHGHGFQRPVKVLAAAEGAVPSFDVGGTAYLHSECGGRVLLASAGSRRFARIVTLARGPVRDLSFGLSGAGAGLVSWIPTACSTDEAAPPAPGPVLASELRAGVFGPPRTLTGAGAVAEGSHGVAVPGGGIVDWFFTPPTGFPAAFGVSLGPAPVLPAGTAALAADGGGDVIAGSPLGPFPGRPMSVIPRGGQVAQAVPGLAGVVVGAQYGRAFGHAWSEPDGRLRLSLWRP